MFTYSFDPGSFAGNFLALVFRICDGRGLLCSNARGKSFLDVVVSDSQFHVHIMFVAVGDVLFFQNRLPLGGIDWIARGPIGTRGLRMPSSHHV